MRNNHQARLAELERLAAKTDTEPEASEGWAPEQWQQRACWAFVHNELQFDRPGHVVVRHCVPPLHDHEFLQAMADWINGCFTEHPGAVYVPLMPDQVEMGLRVLNAGLLDPYFRAVICGTNLPSERCKRCGGPYLDGYCYNFGGRVDVSDLAYALNHSLKVIDAQAPGTFEYNLDGLRQMLTWQKEQIET